MTIMPINNLPDWETRLARQDAFWAGDIIDRPVTIIQLPKANPVWPAKKNWKNHRERWMDEEYVADFNCAIARNTHYYGDALPMAYPNLGPEVFSAFFGQELEYGDWTSWSIPVLHDWAHVDTLAFSEKNFYWKKILSITDAMLAKGRGLFYTGITDLHPGGDAIAAFRDPLNFNLDMIDAAESVQRLLGPVNQANVFIMDFYFRKLAGAGQAFTAWPGIVSTKRWYVPSNDFSCMISKEMFDTLFLPGIAEECRQLEASIYHLDGPNALRHLDSLLGIKELNAIQWVYGDGHGTSKDWLPVYKKCQASGKGLQLRLDAINELDLFMVELRPEGLWITLDNVQNADHAQSLLKKMETWR